MFARGYGLFASGYNHSLYIAACYDTTAPLLSSDQLCSVIAYQLQTPVDTLKSSEMLEQSILDNILAANEDLTSKFNNTDVTGQAVFYPSPYMFQPELFKIKYTNFENEQIDAIAAAYNKKYKADVVKVSIAAGGGVNGLIFKKSLFFSLVLPDLALRRAQAMKPEPRPYCQFI